MVVFISERIPEVCWILQELANEARSMLWAMAGNNVAVLGAFLHCSLEDFLRLSFLNGGIYQ